MAITEEQMEQMCFSLISFSGSARSSYIEAVELAKEGKIPEALERMEQGDQDYQLAHEAHYDLIQEEVAREGGLLTRLTLVHAEDQLMSAETAKIFCGQLIDVYERLNQLT